VILNGKESGEIKEEGKIWGEGVEKYQFFVILYSMLFISLTYYLSILVPRPSIVRWQVQQSANVRIYQLF